MKILVTDKPLTLPRLNRQERGILEQLPDAEISGYDYQSREGLIAAAADVDGVITSFAPFDAQTLRALPKLKAISVSATGCGNIDLETAREMGIMVCNLGEYCTDEVADHTMALLLALARHVKKEDKDVARGGWRIPTDAPPIQLSSATLGIYGFGRIGRAVAARAQAFGMTVLTLDRQSVRESPMPGVEPVSEDEMLKRSDIITNHMPQTSGTEHYFNAPLFARMAKKPIFLNVGRGICVDEYALADALDKGIVSAAGLDVLEREAAPEPEHPLLNRDNVIITPHTAFNSAHSMQVIREQPAINLVACLTGHPEESRFRLI